MRPARGVLSVAAAVLGVFFAIAAPAVTASAATSSVAVPAAAMSDPQFSVSSSFRCAVSGSSYVRVTNNSGASADVKAVINGQQWGTTVTIANGAFGEVGMGTPVPVAAGNVELYKVGSPDTLIDTVPFSLAHCDDLEFTYVDHCSTIDVTIKNVSDTNRVVTFAQTAGHTFQVAGPISVLAGKTAQTTITVTNHDENNNPQVWYTIGAHITVGGDLYYVSFYSIKGLDGDCPPPSTTTPTPTPTVSGGPTATPTGDGSLPETGSTAPVATFVAGGATLLVLGLVALLVARRFRRA